MGYSPVNLITTSCVGYIENMIHKGYNDIYVKIILINIRM